MPVKKKTGAAARARAAVRLPVRLCENAAGGTGGADRFLYGFPRPDGRDPADAHARGAQRRCGVHVPRDHRAGVSDDDQRNAVLQPVPVS